MKNMIFCTIFAAIFVQVTSKKIHQCTCDQQNDCFAEIKNVSGKCLEVCQRQIAPDAKFNPCFDMRKPFVKKLMGDCINAKLEQKQSCTSKNDSIDKINFGALYAKELRPEIEAKQKNFINFVSGLNHTVMEMFENFLNCGRECAFDNVQRMQCFNNKKCAIKVNAQMLKDGIKQCYHELELNKHQHDVCQCFQQKGIDKLKPICGKMMKP